MIVWIGVGLIVMVFLVYAAAARRRALAGKQSWTITTEDRPGLYEFHNGEWHFTPAESNSDV